MCRTIPRTSTIAKSRILLLASVVAIITGSHEGQQLFTPAVAEHQRQLQTSTNYDWLFTTTNSHNGNSLIAYTRQSDGSLSFHGSFPTQGDGGIANEIEGDVADPLGSQASLIVHRDECVFNVNAGSDSITSWRITGPTVEFVGNYASNGNFPASLAASRDTLYVLNAGGEGSISGFSMSALCGLRPLQDSTRILNEGQSNPPFFVTSPAQISFTPNGNFLVATLKGSHSIATYAVDNNGLLAQEPTRTNSNGLTPFGFAFDDDGNLLVSEAFGTAAEVGTADSGAVSSYRFNADGSLSVISGSVANRQTAACWLEFQDGVAVTTNNIASSVSLFDVRDGIVTLDEARVAEVELPLDFKISADGRRVYVLSAGSELEGDTTHQPSIVTFDISIGNGLQEIASTEEALPLGTTTPVISGVVGLALAERIFAPIERECQANAECDVLGLADFCCPTQQGIFLDCCALVPSECFDATSSSCEMMSTFEFLALTAPSGSLVASSASMVSGRYVAACVLGLVFLFFN